MKRAATAVIMAAVAAGSLTLPAAPASASAYYRTLRPHTADALPDAHRCAHPVGAYADDQWCLTVGPWRPVGQPLADALAEGGSRRATERDWRACYRHRFHGETLVTCPRGYVELF